MEREESRHSFHPQKCDQCNPERMVVDDAVIESVGITQNLPSFSTRKEGTHLILDRTQDFVVEAFEVLFQLIKLSILLQRKQRLNLITQMHD
jgi:hypothetical protein